MDAMKPENPIPTDPTPDERSSSELMGEADVGAHNAAARSPSLTEVPSVFDLLSPAAIEGGRA